MIDICDLAVGLSRQLEGRTMPSERPGHRLMETWHPLGVVGVISAFNFPCAVWAWNAAIALVCGDTVVWKPSETHSAGRRRRGGAARPRRPRGRRARRAEHGGRHGRGGRRPAARQPACPAGQRDRVGADGRRGRAAGGRPLRPDHPRAGRQQRRGGRAVGRPRPRGARHRVLRRGHRRPAVHDDAAADRARVGRRRRGREGGGGLPVAAGGRPVRARHPRRPAALPRRLHAHAGGAGAGRGGRRHGRRRRGAGRRERPASTSARRWCGCRPRPRSSGARPSRRSSTCSPTATWPRRSHCTTTCRRGCRRRSSRSDQREAELFLAPDGADCGIVNVNIGTSGAEIGGAFGGEKTTGGGRESGSDAWRGYMRRATNTVNYSRDLPLAQGVSFG